MEVEEDDIDDLGPVYVETNAFSSFSVHSFLSISSNQCLIYHSYSSYFDFLGTEGRGWKGYSSIGHSICFITLVLLRCYRS